jgi:HlyD family secretion protein
MAQNSETSDWSTLKPAVQKAAILAVLAVLATGGVTLYSLSRFGSIPQASLPTPADSVPETKFVTALGRLEPHQEVIHLSAPISPEGSRVDQLLVKEGDRVRSGQILAILDSHERLLTALEQAKEQVRVAQTRLAQVRAGAKAGEINAQQATIARIEAEWRGETTAQTATVARLEAELHNAKIEDQRYQALYQDGAISASERDSKRLTLETVQQQLNEAKANLNRMKQAGQEQLNEAKATLNRIAEVRPLDVKASQAEVSSAIVAVRQAQVNLKLAYVRAPRDGQIMKIQTWPGEVVGDEGIVELGQTHQMYVVAEVYETDVSKVRLGQQATITSSALNGNLQGTVDQIGLQIDKKDILDTDPTEDTDARVVEVKIRLDPASSRKAASLTNLQVKTVINL